MLFSVRVCLVVALMTVGTFATVGCSAPETEVIQVTPETEAALEDYNEQMDKPSSGV